MLTDRLAVIMKSTMVLAGFFGFLIGFTAANWHLGFSLKTALTMFSASAVFRGVVVCLFATFSTRFLMMKLFREHVIEIKRRRDAEMNDKKAAEKQK
jgi:hypothetical protein